MSKGDSSRSSGITIGVFDESGFNDSIVPVGRVGTAVLHTVVLVANRCVFIGAKTSIVAESEHGMSVVGSASDGRVGVGGCIASLLTRGTCFDGSGTGGGCIVNAGRKRVLTTRKGVVGENGVDEDGQDDEKGYEEDGLTHGREG